MTCEFWSESQRKAAKPHVCEACGQPINVGDQYAYMAGKSDGEFFVMKQHAECRAAEVDIAREYSLAGGEEWVFLNNLQEPEDLDFVRERHPAAYSRIAARYASWDEEDNERTTWLHVPEVNA
jgi:hypothetical protein